MNNLDKVTTDSILIKLKSEWEILKEITDQDKLKIQQMKIDLLIDILTEIK